jgi:hypothetical protein
MAPVPNRQASYIIEARDMTLLNNEAMSVKLAVTSNSTTFLKPVFESSFIQYWYCQNFDSNRWKQELTMLNDVGINEIILQTIGDTKSKHVVYPTKLLGYTHNEVDMLENVLAEADLLSMKVRIGIGFNDEWWDKRATDLLWLNNEAAENIAIIDEVVERYAYHPSFSGWYIPHEFCQFTALTDKEQSYLNSFFKQIASEINLKSPEKDIMLSPFYYGKLSLKVLLPVWSSMLNNILNGTGIDILALQDSVGVDYNSTDKLNDLYFYTKKATDKAGVKLYSVTETFSTTSSGNTPVSQDKISKQLSQVEPYVEGFAAFSINHFQNANEPSQSDYYDAYYKYYSSNK